MTEERWQHLAALLYVQLRNPKATWPNAVEWQKTMGIAVDYELKKANLTGEYTYRQLAEIMANQLEIARWPEAKDWEEARKATRQVRDLLDKGIG